MFQCCPLSLSKCYSHKQERYNHSCFGVTVFWYGVLLDVRKVLERVSSTCNVPTRTVTRINFELKPALREGTEKEDNVVNCQPVKR